ncbi:ATP-binding protein [Streptomyces sp. CBMA29]|uniref:ATP-binding protein n=1 Tax=Streptomyces sp. CBMA29 TaxID=1896314 RepID=UPI001661E734|nr:ATP-binding protein [Streptomyces sp. CBMA29]
MTTPPTPPAPRGQRVARATLKAAFGSVGLAREFVRKTLGDWQVADQIDIAELVVSELATNAVKSADAMARDIGVQLRSVERALYIEVWDGGDGTPGIPEQTLDAEGGRGLFLVASLSTRWGVHRPAVGGKIVWSELTLTEPAQPPFLVEDELPVRDPGRRQTTVGSGPEPVHIALTQRAEDGFRPMRRECGQGPGSQVAHCPRNPGLATGSGLRLEVPEPPIPPWSGSVGVQRPYPNQVRVGHAVRALCGSEILA